MRKPCLHTQINKFTTHLSPFLPPPTLHNPCIDSNGNPLTGFCLTIEDTSDSLIRYNKHETNDYMLGLFLALSM